MKKLATIKRLALQIEYQIELEESIPFSTVYEPDYDDKPNKHSTLHRYFPMNTGMHICYQCEFAGFVSLSKDYIGFLYFNS